MFSRNHAEKGVATKHSKVATLVTTARTQTATTTEPKSRSGKYALHLPRVASTRGVIMSLSLVALATLLIFSPKDAAAQKGVPDRHGWPRTG